MAEQHRAAGEALWGGLTVLPQCGGASGAWETQPDVSALQRCFFCTWTRCLCLETGISTVVCSSVRDTNASFLPFCFGCHLFQ